MEDPLYMDMALALQIVLEYYIENSGGLAVNTAMQFTMQLKCIGTYINVGICVLSGA